MFHFTALVTCLAVLVYFLTSYCVAVARGTYGVKAPATTGHPDFERIFRVQMNTLEWMPVFLPALWLFAAYISDAIAAVLGLVWIAGRLLYMTSYVEAASKRGRGFAIQASAAGALWIGATVAIVWRLIHPRDTAVTVAMTCEKRLCPGFRPLFDLRLAPSFSSPAVGSHCFNLLRQPLAKLPCA